MTPGRERLRRSRITLRVTADERRTLAANASRAGLCLSAFLRLVLLGAKPPRAARRPAVETTLLAAALCRLGSVATDLHHIAKALTASGATVLPSLERELLQALAGLRGARLELLRALGRKAAAP